MPWNLTTLPHNPGDLLGILAALRAAESEAAPDAPIPPDLWIRKLIADGYGPALGDIWDQRGDSSETFLPQATPAAQEILGFLRRLNWVDAAYRLTPRTQGIESGPSLSKALQRDLLHIDEAELAGALRDTCRLAYTLRQRFPESPGLVLPEFAWVTTRDTREERREAESQLAQWRERAALAVSQKRPEPSTPAERRKLTDLAAGILAWDALEEAANLNAEDILVQARTTLQFLIAADLFEYVDLFAEAQLAGVSESGRTAMAAD